MIERKLSTKARAHLHREGYPWLDGHDVNLSPGPHLFLDWRHVMPGEIGLIGPYWATAEGKPLPLRLDKTERKGKDRNISAHYVPQDVPRGVRIVSERAEKTAPFPIGGPPGIRIVQDHGIYRTWYSPGKVVEPRLHYSESGDGFSWEESEECSFDWSACPNIDHGGSQEIFLDPAGQPEERFKMFFAGGIPEDQKEHVVEIFQRDRPDAFIPVGRGLEHLSGMWAAVSPDGIHWKGLPGPLVIHYSDTLNVVYYDGVLERYVWYSRFNSFYGRRCIGRAETEDFLRWPAPDMMVWPTTDLHPADDLYTNSKTVYPGTIDHHLMFPALYHHSDDISEIRLYSSPDGIVWSQVPGGPVLEVGEPGSWEGGCVFGGLDLIPLSGGRIALPYTGYLYPHKYPRNRSTLKSRTAYAVWPAGRLGGIEALEEGRFTTLPMTIAGQKLVLNVKTKHAGHVLVEVTDRKGRALSGRSFDEADPITGDYTNRTVTWRGESNVKVDPEQPVLLRFRMRAAKIFSFEIESK